MKKLISLTILLFCCTFLTPFSVSAEGPTCVHIHGVEVVISQEQTRVVFTNHTYNGETINWEVWSNDPNYNPKKIASGTTYVPPSTKEEERTTMQTEKKLGTTFEYINVPQGWNGAWLKHCKN